MESSVISSITTYARPLTVKQADPQLTEALLNVLYPHYLAPIPSMAVVQLVVDPARAQLPKGFFVPRHSKLKTRPIPYAPGMQLPCQYRTGYPVHLWPVLVESAQLQPPPFREPLRPPPRTAAVPRTSPAIGTSRRPWQAGVRARSHTATGCRRMVTGTLSLG